MQREKECMHGTTSKVQNSAQRYNPRRDEPQETPLLALLSSSARRPHERALVARVAANEHDGRIERRRDDPCALAHGGARLEVLRLLEARAQLLVLLRRLDALVELCA